MIELSTASASSACTGTGPELCDTDPGLSACTACGRHPKLIPKVEFAELGVTQQECICRSKATQDRHKGAFALHGKRPAAASRSSFVQQQENHTL